MIDQPILVSAQPEFVLVRTDTSARGGKGWRHVKQRVKHGSARASWGWPGETKVYPTRDAALRVGRSR